MTLWLTTKRVAQYGIIGFIRNGFISLSAILILTITLFVMAALMITGSALTNVLKGLTDKVDVTVYLTTNATDDQTAQLKSLISALPQVSSVTYTSRDQALADFQLRHQNDQLTIQALQELGNNPLGASFDIHAKDPSQYESIAKYVSDEQATGQGLGTIISKINFSQNKGAIDRLTNIIDTSRKLGATVAAIFAIASLLIAFNTIRLVIYTSRDEIGVMNLVGASRWYVRGPFMVSGVLYGIVAALLVTALLYPLTLWLGPASEKFLGSFNVFRYYSESFFQILLVTMGSGIMIGAVSSYLAVRRYLKM